MRSYFDGIFRYADFSGRSSRAQYWIFHTVSLFILVAVAFIEFKLEGLPRGAYPLPMFMLLCLFHTLPSLSITVRRLHDIGRSGWWYWIGMVPFGSLLVLVWTLMPSEDGSNDYGDPNVLNDIGPSPRQKGGRNLAADRLAAAAGRRNGAIANSRLPPSEGRFI